jgi:tetratricopeptide (TPR) repeat protein
MDNHLDSSEIAISSRSHVPALPGFAGVPRPRLHKLLTSHKLRLIVNVSSIFSHISMSSQTHLTLQGIIKQRQSGEFVGRDDYVELFRKNLALPIDSEVRRFIFAISGQGGVGKTWLLHRFGQLAEDSRTIVGGVDESTRDIPALLSQFARQFETAGHPLKGFDERYRTYREKRHELEADPQAPQGFPSLIGRAVAKGGLKLARRIPVGGLAFDFVEEEALASVLGDVATYVSRRLTNKDEVQLVLEPIEVLTPLFLKDLTKITNSQTVSLFFDTYEQTGVFLDAWLRELLEGRYGPVPSGVLIVIAGQTELDKNDWAPYEGILARLQLEPFSESEAREFLARKGITDAATTNTIIRISGCLPLLLATLATDLPRAPTDVDDPTDTAVIRFLKWVDDPLRRDTALNAAVPRQLNQDILRALAPTESADTLFSWLKTMPFVNHSADGWKYHNLVRDLMSRQKRNESELDWKNLHAKLAEHYERITKELHVRAGDYNPSARRASQLEWLYHTLCYGAQNPVQIALDGFVEAFSEDHRFAEQWADTMAHVATDGDVAVLDRWANQLKNSLQKLRDKQYDPLIDTFTTLLERQAIEAGTKDIILFQRALLYMSADRYELAESDLTRLITSGYSEAVAFFFRAIVNEHQEKLNEALSDLDLAFESTPNKAVVSFERAKVLKKLTRYTEALRDFQLAEQTETYRHIAPKEIAAIQMELEDYPAALESYVRALHSEPACQESWEGVIDVYERLHLKTSVGEYLRKLEVKASTVDICCAQGYALLSRKHYEEAITVGDKARELDSKRPEPLEIKGLSLMALRRFEPASKAFHKLTVMDEPQAASFANYGESLAQLDRFEEAIANYDRAFEFNDQRVKPYVSRGRAYGRIGKLDRALEDLDKAVDINPQDVSAIFARGRVFWRARRFEEALQALNDVISIVPDQDPAYSYRARIWNSIGNTEAALKDVSHALEINIESSDAYLQRGIANRTIGKTTEALDDLRKALELNPYNRHEAQKELGKTFFAMSRFDKALKAFEKSLSIGPTCSECWKLLAKTFELLGSTNVASSLRAIKVPTSTSPNVIYARAQAMKAQGLLDEALAEFGKVLAQDEHHVPAISGRAEIYLELGAYERSLKNYERALGIDADYEQYLRTEIGKIREIISQNSAPKDA